MPARIYVPQPLSSGQEIDLPPEAARHVQVLRMQPGQWLHLFDGSGGEWQAEVLRMGRQTVAVQIQQALPAVQRELVCPVTLALGMPANERMDALVEKATELGAAGLQPLVCARSVLRLSGERADKRCAHWQAVAVAASEQSGRTRVPQVQPVRTFAAWLNALEASPGHRFVLSFSADALPARTLLPLALAAEPVLLLSGPEGGLDETEEALARSLGFAPLSLGPRVLRADTAPLAALALLGAGG